MEFNYEDLKSKIREKMSGIYKKLLKNIVGLESTGNNSSFKNEMINKREKFKKLLNKENSKNYIDKLKTSNSILQEFNLNDKSKKLLLNKYNEIIKIFSNNNLESLEKNKENIMKKYEENIMKNYEYKDPNIKNLNFNKKNNTNNLNNLKDCDLIIKDKDKINLINGEEVDIIVSGYPYIKWYFDTMPENLRKIERYLKIGKAKKFNNKLKIYGDKINMSVDNIPIICTVSDTFFDRLSNIIYQRTF